MTVLQGARPIATGGLRVDPRYRGTRDARPAAARNRRAGGGARSRTTGRVQPFGALIAIVLVALAVGLIYVAQTVRLAGINYEIDGLTAQRDDVARQLQTLQTSVLRWGTEATVLDGASRVGLVQLETRVRLPAR